MVHIQWTTERASRIYMSEANPIQGQTIEQPIVVSDGRTFPAHGLFQSSFDLSDADFLRLQQPNPITLAVGSAILSFALSYGLPLVAKLFFDDKNPPSRLEWIITGLLALIGLIIVVLSWWLSPTRRKVIKRITKHFEDHPTQKTYLLPRQ